MPWIKSNINKYKKFDIKIIMKKLYSLGCRNILVEGGNDLTEYFLKKKLFNCFYLFKSPRGTCTQWSATATEIDNMEIIE